MAEAWLESMIEEIRSKESELNNLKKAANTIFRSKGEESPFPDTDDPSEHSGPMRIRADEFYGKPFATAARTYLLKKKQAVEAEEIVRALEQGGFDFNSQGWKVEDRLRVVSMSMAKNTAQFHKLPTGTYGLPEWYPDAMKKKAKKAEDKERETKDETANE